MASPHPLSATQLFNLKGRVAVVTGAWTGIGLIIAQTLAANGAKVYITSRRIETLEKSARIHGSPERLGDSGGSIIPLVMDVTSKESIRAAVEEIGSKETHVDILVNNAGVFNMPPGVKPEDGPETYSNGLFNIDIDGWQQLYLTNCTAIFFVTTAFIPLLSKAASSPVGAVGNVINVLSKEALLKPSSFGQFAYAASKAAALHLTRQMAFELFKDPLNLRVNAIAPGPTPTAMTGQGTVDEENMGIASDEIFDMAKMYTGFTTKRWNKPQEISSASIPCPTLSVQGSSLTSA
ncbi:putative short-chain dehydrogenase protein [Eutypa lata UCREL1]|uniref:Putative short-chain dehydrogenase protein n=1 Tax=Eutypa lata (strain UCR-EL1) TaxID=1287681 RepID=M7SPB5_EUTLA|nr:putative short-chain dehydrogenase protein [Eutypa lata UCREL1]